MGQDFYFKVFFLRTDDRCLNLQKPREFVFYFRVFFFFKKRHKAVPGAGWGPSNFFYD